VSDLFIPKIGPHISLQQNRQTDPGKYIFLSQIYECRNWETEHFNSILEISVSFLKIHKWEPDIYIGFSPALHFAVLLLSCKERKGVAWVKGLKGSPLQHNSYIFQDIQHGASFSKCCLQIVGILRIFSGAKMLSAR
jgi:hypothetical protein